MVRKVASSNFSAGLTLMLLKSANTWANKAGWASKFTQSPSLHSPSNGLRTVNSTPGGGTISPLPISSRVVVVLAMSSVI